MTRVLIVTNDNMIAESLADGLDGQDDDVVVCPGPQTPTCVCVGVRTGHCPLTTAAEIVVLDGWLASDEHRCGVPSWHLLQYYRQQGIPVVALVGPDGLPGKVSDPGVTALPRAAPTPDIVAAVGALRGAIA